MSKKCVVCSCVPAVASVSFVAERLCLYLFFCLKRYVLMSFRRCKGTTFRNITQIFVEMKKI